MKMVPILAGHFQMGSSPDEDAFYADEAPAHNVTLAESFRLGTAPVTQAQYEAVMGNNPSDFKGRDRPVERVSWYDAMAFCKKLSDQTGQKFTLPTEAQWEYACRAGSLGSFCFGENELGDYAWYFRNSDDETHPVGQKKPNAWGLYDMHGNVREWCLDHWHNNYNGAPEDGSAWFRPERSDRITRGGSWYDDANECRAACRLERPPSHRDAATGFRVLAVAAGAKQRRLH